jgi:hypothetical protein
MEVLSEDKIDSENAVVLPMRHAFTRPSEDYLLTSCPRGGALQEPPFPTIPVPSCDSVWSEKGRFLFTFRISISPLLRTGVSSLQHSCITHSIHHRTHLILAMAAAFVSQARRLQSEHIETYIPEASNLHSYRREKLKWCVK